MEILLLERGLHQINGLPFSALDPGANLCWGLTLLGLFIGIDRLLHAGRADCPMAAFEAAMQTVVSHRPVAMAIARLLVEYAGDLGCHFIGDHLVGVREVGAAELCAAQDRWQIFPGSSRVVGRHIVGGIGPLRGRHHSYKTQHYTPKDSFHAQYDKSHLDTSQIRTEEGEVWAGF